jgi:hypothetical protein
LISDFEKQRLKEATLHFQRHFEVMGQDKYKPLVVNLFEAVDIKYYHASFKKFA